MQYFQFKGPFELESGAILDGLTIAYSTYGLLNADKTNVVWVCHALTANSEVFQWWAGLFGENKCINPKDHYVVCANILGSCYGTTGPLSTNPGTGEPYFSRFPQVTIRDMVHAHILLRKHLEIPHIRLLLGGSMGGYQALEWAVMEKSHIGDIFLIATSATESAWGIGIHAAQRMAIEGDQSWRDNTPNAGHMGLKAARAMGILTYRNYRILAQKQTDSDIEKRDNYRASSYVSYQGEKLAERFNAFSYWLLTKAMDSHHLARGRAGQLIPVLNGIHQRTLVIGITSDILCPLEEQRMINQHLPNAKLIEIDSAYGHDGFMVEVDKISAYLKEWMNY